MYFSKGDLDTMDKKTMKFDENDRHMVINKLQDTLHVSLSPIRNYRKYLKDENGNRYCVLGGYDTWHGIPGLIIDENTIANVKRYLVIAVKLKSKMDLYIGLMDSLIENKHKLTKTKEGEYHFDINTRNDALYINQLPNFRLTKIAEVENLKDIYDKFNKLSDAEKEDIINKLKSMTDLK